MSDYLVNSCKKSQRCRLSPMLQNNCRNSHTSEGKAFLISLGREADRRAVGKSPELARPPPPPRVRALAPPLSTRLPRPSSRAALSSRAPRRLRAGLGARDLRVARGWRPRRRAGGWDRGRAPGAGAGAQERHGGGGGGGGGIRSPRRGEVRGRLFTTEEATAARLPSTRAAAPAWPGSLRSRS